MACVSSPSSLILNDEGELTQAMELLKEMEQICREIGEWDGLQRSLGQQAAILRDEGEFKQAMTLFKEKERICRELESLDSLAISLGSQALIQGQEFHYKEALSLAEEAYTISVKHGYIGTADWIKSILDTIPHHKKERNT